MLTKDRDFALAKILLARYGRTFSEELEINIHENTPSSLFRLLVATILFSARISAKLAKQAARALTEQGWTTPEKLVAASWEERTQTLNRSGYARYDDRMSRMLEDSAQLLLDRYQGDLRKLREDAGRNIALERQLLKEFKGIGNVGVDIFLREVQVAWEELFPFADERACQNARTLGLPADAMALLELVGKDDLPRFLSALVRVGLTGEREAVLEELHKTENAMYASGKPIND